MMADEAFALRSSDRQLLEVDLGHGEGRDLLDRFGVFERQGALQRREDALHNRIVPTRLKPRVVEHLKLSLMRSAFVLPGEDERSLSVATSALRLYSRARLRC
jgi:hypothetical protein